MDGIAVRASDTVGASESTPLLLHPGAFVVLDTGDPMPDGFDAVVMREHVHYVDGQAELRAPVAPYRHMRSIGEDISAGELLLPAGHRLRPVDAAAAAAAGATEVRVHRQPVVAILPTGDEMRPIGSDLEPGELLETNSLMLAGQAREAGCEVVVLPIEPDDEARIADAIRDAVRRCDLLIVIAGSSAGRDDHTAALVGRLGDARRPRRRRPARPSGRARGGRHDARARRARLSGVGVADVRDLRRAAAGRARGCHRVRTAVGPGAARAQARVDDRDGRLGAGAARARRRRARRLAVAARRRRADFAGPRRRAPGRPLRASRAITPARRSRSSCCAASREIERTIVAIGSHDMILDLAASQLRARDPT